MGLDKFSAALDLLKGFDVNLYVGEDVFKGKLIAAGGFEKDGADEIIGEGNADLVAFGRHFISNPDLPFRFKNDLPLTPYDRDTFYGGTAIGYTDYPAYSAELIDSQKN